MFLKTLEVAFYLSLSYLILLTHAKQTSYKIPTYEKIIWHKDFKKTKNSNEYFNEYFKEDFSLENYYHFSGKKITYFDKNRKIQSQYKLKEDEFLVDSKLGYITYQKIGETIHFFDYYRVNKWNLKTASYPLLSANGNRILLVSTDVSTFSLYDRNMNPIITNKTLAPLITDFAFCDYDNSLTLSTINAQVINIDFQGNIRFQKSLVDSEYNYIKSILVSPKGSKIICLGGLYPEYLYLLNTEGKVIWKTKTSCDRRKKNEMFIDDQNNLLFDLQKEKIMLYTLNTGKVLTTLDSEKIDFQITPKVKIHFSSVDDFYGILLDNNILKKLLIFNVNQQLIFTKEIKNIEKVYDFFLKMNKNKDKIYINIYTIDKIISSLVYL